MARKRKVAKKIVVEVPTAAPLAIRSLRARLRAHGLQDGPIVPSTRVAYERLLHKYQTMKAMKVVTSGRQLQQVKTLGAKKADKTVACRVPSHAGDIAQARLNYIRMAPRIGPEVAS